MSVYDFTVKTRKGADVPLSDYKGKVLLIVNTATACGFTPQYKELQEIYDAHQKDGLEILDFPCNQFGNQAPGTDDEIHTFCTGRFGITFPQFGKIEVNGPGADPLYKWLTDNTTFDGFDDNDMGRLLDEMFTKSDPNYQETSSIKWNFTKFLIDREGNIVARFEPTNSMDAVKEKVEAVL
ncbi:MAG: glutathione peroxidase [Oscillibacter sp.]|nr:glutathione peroxidase [Oscillibacter sp.]